MNDAAVKTWILMLVWTCVELYSPGCIVITLNIVKDCKLFLIYRVVAFLLLNYKIVCVRKRECVRVSL